MTKTKYILYSLVLVFIASGCSQKQVQPPPPQSSVTRSTAPIRVQTIDDTDYANQDMQAKRAPAPINLPIVKDEERREGSTAEPPVLLSPAYVNDRVFEYGRKLERWKELDDQSVVMSLDEQQSETMVRCFKDLQKVLNGYQKLYDELLQKNTISSAAMYDTEDVLDLQKLDIAFLEGVCGKLLAGKEDKSVGWQERQEGADLNQIETLIERYSDNKEYDEVVQVWRRVPDFQIERIDLKTKILYGNALKYIDKPEKAAEIYQQIVDEMSVSKEQPTDLLSLRKVLADLYTASGNYLAAEGQYDQISTDYSNIGKIEEWSKLQLSILERSKKGSPEVTEYSNLLRAYLGFLPERDGYKVVWQADKFLEQYPYSPVASNVDLIKAQAQNQADEWFNSFFAKVNSLAGEKKFQDAMELLQSIPTDLIDDEKAKSVKDKTDELVLAEAVEQETIKLERMQELQRRWNEGLQLADKDDFDGAITIFTELLDTEYGTKAEKKIDELSLQAAKMERRKAADLFVRFTKTADIESRKHLLVESRRVLKGILVKYPDVDIADKVVGNISRVEKEMNDLDPLLLPTIEQEELAQAQKEETAQDTPVKLDVFDMPLPSTEKTEAQPVEPVQPINPEESLQSGSAQPLPVLTTPQYQ